MSSTESVASGQGEASLSEAARHYAFKGLPQFPIWGMDAHGRCECGTNCGRDAGKHPVGVLVPNGYKNASYDRLVVERWRSRYPNANIGYAIPLSIGTGTGPPIGVQKGPL